MSDLIGNIKINDPLDEKIVERRRAVLRHWGAFKRSASPFLVEVVIDRQDTFLPDDVAPWAPGIVLAGDYLLRKAKYRPGMRRPGGWSLQYNTFLKFPGGPSRLMVSQCGEFWTVKRSVDRKYDILAYQFGLLPIFTRTYQAAMRLAECCHPCPRGAASTLRWVSMDAHEFLGI